VAPARCEAGIAALHAPRRGRPTTTVAVPRRERLQRRVSNSIADTISAIKARMLFEGAAVPADRA
jgi:hypothetical protein